MDLSIRDSTFKNSHLENTVFKNYSGIGKLLIEDIDFSKSKFVNVSELEDLSENLEQYDGRPEAIDDFMAFVSENQSKRLEGNTRDLLNELSIIDIAPWRYGNAFYWKEGAVRVGNLMGVLLTAILLTLGAPFWYGALKKGVAFRDLLAPREEEQKTTDANKPDTRSSDGNN